MTTKPYRHELIVPDASAIEEFVNRQTLKNVRAIEPTDKALERIANTKLVSQERAISWGLHPDERVGMAMLVAHEKRKVFGHQGSARVRWLLERQMEEANRTGVLWTPILDKIAVLNLWYSDKYRAGPEAWVKRLEPWIRQQKDPNQIHDLLRFRAVQIWFAVARTAVALGGGVFEKLLADPRYAPALAENPSLQPEHFAVLRKWMIEQVRNAPDTIYSISTRNTHVLETLKTLLKRGWEPDPDFVEALRRVAREKDVGDRGKDYAARTLALKLLLLLPKEVTEEELVEMHEQKTVPQDVLQEIMKRARGKEDLELRIARTLKAGSYLREYLRRGFYRDRTVAENALRSYDMLAIAEVLKEDADPDLAEQAFEKLVELQQRWRGGLELLLKHVFKVEHLQRLYRLRKGEPEIVVELINHPVAGPALWREIAQEQRSPLVRRALAQNAQARKDETVRATLLGSQVPDIIYALCEDEIPEELPGLVRNLAKKGDARVINVLKKAPDEVLQQLDASLLTPWLTSAASQVRLDAILLVGRLMAVRERGRAGIRQRK